MTERSDAELGIAAARAGADVVRARYRSALARIEKSPRDFATDVDLAAERAILELLHTARPSDGLVGEESGVAHAGTSPRRWLVDPLCGTLNYAAGTPLVAVNVALRVGAEVTAAAVADPFADEVMWTDSQRAWTRLGGHDSLLRPSSDSMLVDVNLDAPYPNGDRFRAVALLADPRFAESFGPRVCSTTLALAWVAAGRRAAYVTDGHLAESVHFTSGIALCEAAGCVMSNLHGGPVHTGIGGLVVAADDQTHEALLAIVSRQFDA